MKKYLFASVLTLLIALPVRAQVAAQKSVEDLKVDLEKVEASIEATRDRMKTIGDARFLPDLYFILAELNVNKARYMIAIKQLSNKGVPPEELDFTNEKRPKLQAIELYQQILDKFPTIGDRDKALFFQAHEYRELGDFEKMINVYQRLTREFPNSLYWSESQLIVANHVLDRKKDVDFALQLYQQILARPADHFTPLARYKMGWAYINKAQWKDALLAFEGVLTTDSKIDLSKLPEIYKKTDVRQDALITMVWPYSEITQAEIRKMSGMKRDEPLPYFQRLSPNLAAYQKVLRRLSTRLITKKRFVDATRVSFALLQATGELEARMEAVENVYRSMKDTQQPWPIVGYVEEVAKTARQVNADPKLSEKEKRAALTNYEIFARDVATRIQRRARTTKTKEDYRLAVYAYRDYLWAFPQSKFRNQMKLNLAESYFNMGDFVQAGTYYEQIARSNSDPRRAKEFWDSSLQAFTRALREQALLNRLELTEARAGLRSVGRTYIQRFPKDRVVPEVQFNIARTFYDERKFDEAVKAFDSFLTRYPNTKDSALAADLILDSFNQREDYDGLINAGNRLLRNRAIPQPVRSNVGEIVKQAQLKRVQMKSGDFTSANYSQNLLKLAEQYKGTDLGEQALYEAFLSLRAKKDPKAYEPGETLLVKYGNSKYAKEVVSAMGQMAITTADFRRAALYFETYSQKYPADPQSRQLLANAAQFREAMGDFQEAAANYQKLGDSEGVARNHFSANAWRLLSASAAMVGGIKGQYWQGLALYRQGQVAAARPFLQNASGQRPSGFEESAMVAHSLYLLSIEALKSYEAVQMRAGQETQAVQQKAQMLAQLTAQMNRVIALGNGRWTIAALYVLGKANAEFGSFVKNAPMPPGLTAQQVGQFKAALTQQASQYDKAASGFFQQCLSNAEKFEVFTQFVRGCQSRGKDQVDEASETRIVARASQVSPQATGPIRRRLYDDSRNVKLLIDLAAIHTQNRDYSMSITILNRAAEVSPNTSSVYALQGTNYLFMNDLERAHQSFQKSIQVNPRDPNGLWGLSGLYRTYGYQTKFRSTVSRARSAGRPSPPLHPFVSQAMQ